MKLTKRGVVVNVKHGEGKILVSEQSPIRPVDVWHNVGTGEYKLGDTVLLIFDKSANTWSLASNA
jgi:hypothetical protein